MLQMGVFQDGFVQFLFDRMLYKLNGQLLIYPNFSVAWW